MRIKVVDDDANVLASGKVTIVGNKVQESRLLKITRKGTATHIIITYEEIEKIGLNCLFEGHYVTTCSAQSLDEGKTVDIGSFPIRLKV